MTFQNRAESKKVSVEYTDNIKYPKSFFPSKCYPEYPWDEENISSEKNDVYELVRRSFVDLKLDVENFGQPSWNPLKEYVKPGNKVVIKPNLVLHKNYRKGYETDVQCVFTQPSVVAAVIDYVVIALQGQGSIILGDAPVQKCDFVKLIHENQFAQMVRFYQDKGINIQLKDFRGVISVSDYGVLHQTERKDAEFQIVHLDRGSRFCQTGGNQNYRITNYEPSEILKHHQNEQHEYCVAKDVLKADCIINLPKPKTHKKAGLTACLKNMVGINCRKEYLPHHTMGCISDGGDEYNGKSVIKISRAKSHDMFCKCIFSEKYVLARFFQAVVLAEDILVEKVFRDKSSFGSWSGNNTISKTIVDLNRIVKYADKDGVLRSEEQRKLFNVADMVVSGEGNGPMAPKAKQVGLIVCGEDSFDVDCVIAEIMGAKLKKIPTLTEYGGVSRIDSVINDVKLVSNDSRWDGKRMDEIPSEGIMMYEPADGWEDCFEI